MFKNYIDSISCLEMNKNSWGTHLNWSGKSILIIENDSISSLLIQEYFTSIPYKDIPFLSSNDSFDLIIIDISLLELHSDFKNSRKIRHDFPDIPLLAYSASVQNHEIEACIKACFDNVIPKPVNFRKLTDLLDTRIYLKFSKTDYREIKV